MRQLPPGGGQPGAPGNAIAVHPESYDSAKALLKTLGFSLGGIRNGGVPQIGPRAKENRLEKLAAELDVGLPTLEDMLADLTKPVRDPREELPAPALRTDALDIKDLKPGMELTSTVRNVIDFFNRLPTQEIPVLCDRLGPLISPQGYCSQTRGRDAGTQSR